ncbi:MAG: hypothetical protein ACP5OU_06610 [Methanothrix sp.]
MGIFKIGEPINPCAREARLLQELFQAMLEELMSGRLPAGALVQVESSG